MNVKMFKIQRNKSKALFPLCLLLFVISLGKAIRIPLGEVSYNLTYIEIVMPFLFLYLLIKHRKIYLTYYDKLIMFLFSIIIVVNVVQPFFYGDFSMLMGFIIYSYGLLAYLIMVLLRTHITEKDIIISVRLFSLSIFFQLIVVYLKNSTLIFNSFSYYQIKDSIELSFGKSNYIAIFAAFILLLELWLKKEKWQIFSFLGGISLLLTLSKGAILTCISVILLASVFQIIRQRSSMKKILKLILILGLILLIFRQTYLGAIFFDVLKSGYLAGREEIFSENISVIKNNLVFGTGFSNDNNPHNYIIKALRDYGVFFGTLNICLLLFPLSRIKIVMNNESSEMQNAVFFSMFYLLIHTLMEIFFSTPESLIFFSMFLFILNNFTKDLELKNECFDCAKL